MTKCIVLSPEGNEEQEKPKPIEFIGLISDEGMSEANWDPEDFEVIELVLKRAVDFDRMDLMLCYDNDREAAGLYAGHWNDGVVE